MKLDGLASAAAASEVLLPPPDSGSELMMAACATPGRARMAARSRSRVFLKSLSFATGSTVTLKTFSTSTPLRRCILAMRSWMMKTALVRMASVSAHCSAMSTAPARLRSSARRMGPASRAILRKRFMESPWSADLGLRISE